jgi:hypothetical protein
MCLTDGLDDGLSLGLAETEGFAVGKAFGILLDDGLFEGNGDDDGAGLNDGAQPSE